MPSHNATIAEAVKVALNTASSDTPSGFSIPFVAERTYEVDMDAAKMDPATLYVHVVSKSDDNEQFTRGPKSHDVKVDVGIRKKLKTFTGGKVDNAEVDALVEFAESIVAFFKPGYLGTTGAMFVRVEHPVLYFPGHLREVGVFTSVVTVTYKLIT